MGLKFGIGQAYTIAKDFTEKAIENNLILPQENSTDTAKEIMNFFHLVVESVLHGE